MRASLLVVLSVAVLSCDTAEKASQPSPGLSSGVWSQDSIIDIHGHTGTFAGYDLSVSTLVSNIDSFGVRMVLISNIDGANLPGMTLNLDARAANEATLGVVLENSGRIRGIAWARPPDGSPSDVEQFLQPSAANAGISRPFVAIKLHPQMNQFPANAPAVDPYFELARKYRIPVVYHSDKPGTNADPALIYEAARRHPDVPVVLYHMVFFGPHAAAVDVVEQSTRNGDADLYLETAQADPEAVVSAIQRVGAERVLFGTDATYYGASHYGRYTDLVELLRRELSPEDFANVMRNNALRVFRLDEAM